MTTPATSPIKKQITQLMIILLIALCVWFLGPLIAIKGHVYLQSASSRLLIILVLVLAWGLKNIIHQLPKQLKLFSAISTEKSTQGFDEAEVILRKHFKQVLDYCRKQIKLNLWTRFFARTPITLVLGTKSSGKSALLKQANMDFHVIPARAKQHLQLKHKDEGVLEHGDAYDHDAKHTLDSMDVCHWLIKNNHIFLDTPGDFATAEVGSKNNTPWAKLLSLLKFNKRRLPVTGIILIINLAELANQSKKQANLHIHLLKQRLLECHKELGASIPLYIVFSKCDLISGFREYFDNLNETARSSQLFISLHLGYKHTNLTDTFKKDYLDLLQQINSHILTRLHQEHNPEKRELIKDYANQLDQLKDIITHVVYHLAEKTSYCDATVPKGVYFTSAEQVGQPMDLLQKPLSKSFTLQDKPLTPHYKLLSKAYFIQGFLQTIISTDNHHKKNHPRQPLSWQRYGIYGTACVIVIVSSLFIANTFQRDLLKANQTQDAIFAYHMIQGNKTPQENATLMQLVANFDQSANFWLLKPSKKITIKHPIKTALQDNGLLENFIPQLTQSLEQHLQNQNAQPKALYNNLKVYLMLANPKQLHINFLINWLQQHVHNTNLYSYINTENARLALTKALSHDVAPIQLNNAIIQQARKTLLSLPKSFLAYVILQSNIDNNPSRALILSNDIFTASKPIAIPYLYTAMGLQTLFLNNYQRAATEAVKGNWVLGVNQQANDSQIQNTIQQLINLYAADYTNWWATNLYHIQLPAVNNLQQTANLVAQLNDPNKGLMHFLQVLQLNTNANKILPATVTNPDINIIRNALTKNFGQRFQAIDQLADNKPLKNILNQYNQYLQSILSANNPQQAAFIVTAKRFQQPQNKDLLNVLNQLARGLPAPFGGWFNQLASNTWQSLITETQSFIQQQWQNSVVAIYNNNLKDHFPLFANAVSETDLSEFSQFFAPDGIFEGFFKLYLQPFINMQQSQWQWKVVDGKQLTFSGNSLATLERGRIITTMFFPNNSNKMNVNFSLQQVAMMPIVKSLHIVINGQTLTDQRGSRNVNSFIWPGNSATMNATVTFADINGQNAMTTHSGPWAWFHILASAQIKATNDPLKFDLTFDVDGNEAKYLLVASNPINPFIPGIVDQFRIPGRL